MRLRTMRSLCAVAFSSRCILIVLLCAVSMGAYPGDIAESAGDQTGTKTTAAAATAKPVQDRLTLVRETSGTTDSGSPLPQSGASALQVFVALLFIVMLMLALAWYARRMQIGVLGGTQSMRVLCSLSLGARERAVLIQLGDTQVLLGVAPGRVNQLAVFEQPVVEASDTVGAIDNGFASRLREALQPRSDASPAETPGRQP